MANVPQLQTKDEDPTRSIHRSAYLFYSFHLHTGELAFIDSVTDIENPSYLVVHPTNQNGIIILANV